MRDDKRNAEHALRQGVEVGNHGTPRTLAEAIAMSMPPLKSQDLIVVRVQASVKDFLAQHFTTAMCDCPDDNHDDLRALFERCTR